MSDFVEALIEDLGAYSNKPLDFVMWAFPWGVPDTELEDLDGPDTWQLQLLKDLQEGVRTLDGCWNFAVRSGHGVGKSAFFSWLILWAISTREMTRGRVTANTKEQLMRVLWGELNKWHRLFIGKQLFNVTATAIFSADPALEKEWRIDAIPWSEDNPEAFAGLHNFGKRILILCDEASALPAVIWEVLDGATTDANTQIIWGVAGNPTRNIGRFRDCFETFSKENGGPWHTYQVDARSSRFSNKKLIAEWAAKWGEDSDFFRVRVRGEFPNSSATQLIPIEAIHSAQAKEVQSTPWEPLILGVDIARFGTNASVAQFRRGRDARTMPPHRWRGLTVPETANRVAALMAEHEPDAVFIDEGGIGGGVIDVLRQLGHSVLGVNFGVPASSRPDGTLVANKRAEMYVSLRDWLREGGCIPASDELEKELLSIEYYYNKKQEILLVSKEDMRSIGVASPDWADALALTFAYPVSLKAWRGGASQRKVDYDPLGLDRMPNFDKGPSRVFDFQKMDFH